MRKLAMTTASIVLAFAGIIVGANVAAAQTGWSAPTQVAPGEYLASVSCPTTSFCAAVGSGFQNSASGNGTYGTALAWNGTRWSSPRDVDGYSGLEAVSCASPSFCVAVDMSGHAVSWNGRSWSRPEPVANGYLTGVSCTAAGVCVALDGLTGTAFAFSGGAWVPDGQPVYSGDLSDAISCPTTSNCMVVSDGGISVSGGSGMWSPAGVPTSDFRGVSCPAIGWCVVAADTASNAPGHIFTTGPGGWQPTTVPNFAPTSVSCASRSMCTVTGRSRAVMWDGTHWSSPQMADTANTGLTSISCPTTTFCVAVDQGGNAVEWRS